MNNIDANVLIEAFEKAANPVALFSEKGEIAWANKAFSGICTANKNDIVGRKASELLNGFEVNGSSVFLPEQDASKSLSPRSQVIFFVTKEGKDHWAKVSFSVTQNTEGQGRSILGIFTEITGKQEKLQLLADRIKRNKKILSSLNEGYILVDEHAKFHEANQAYCDIVGYTREELLSMKLTDVRPGMTSEYQEEFIDSVLKQGGRKFETQHQTKSGEMVDLEANAAAIEKDGTIYLAGFVWDITDRNEAKRRLKESEQRWQRLVKNNPLCVMISKDGEIKYVNKAGLELYEAERTSQLVGKSILDFVHDDHREEVKNRIKKINEEEVIELSEQKIITLGGTVKEIEAHSVPIIYKEQQAAQTVLKDITEAKKKERALQESQQRFKSLFKHNPHPVYHFDLEGNFLGANRKTEEVSGYPEEELLNMNFAPIIVEEDLEKTQEHFESAAAGSIEQYEIKIKTKEGKIKDLHVTNFPMKVANEIVGVFGIAEDITATKKAALDLKRSEQKWQHLVEDNPQPVQVSVDGKVVFINEAGAKLYGAENPQQLIGMSVFQFTHDDEKEKIIERKKRLEEGHPVGTLHENKIIRLDGSICHVEVNSIPIEYQGEKAIQTVLHDITDRWKKEQIIKESLEEKEVLLKEIHHRVKNNMAVISGLLELQAMSTEDPGLRDLLQESQLRIFSMAMIHEKLYQTETFAHIEFAEYVKELVSTITNTIDIGEKDIAVRYDIGAIRLNINQAIPAALILNEAVVNAYKHAFEHKKEGTISIEMSQNGKNICLSISDNGIGLPEEFVLNEQQSLGMSLIQTLSRQLYGELSMSNSSDSSGTRVTIRFPKDG